MYLRLLNYMKMRDHSVLLLIERTLTLMAVNQVNAGVMATAVAPVPEIRFLEAWIMKFDKMDAKSIKKAQDLGVRDNATMALFQTNDGNYVLKHTIISGDEQDPRAYQFKFGPFPKKPTCLDRHSHLICKVKSTDDRRAPFQCIIEKQGMTFSPN